METLRASLKQRALVLGVVLFDGYELLDVYGPLELFFCINGASSKNPLQLIYLSPNGEPVTAMDGRTKTLVDYSIASNIIPSIDVLFIPGGQGTRPLQKDPDYMNALASLGDAATMVLTVCTGSMLFAKTGLLDGVNATTNKVAFRTVQSKYPNVNWQEKARFVMDGKFISSSGVSAGIDMAHFFLKQLYDEKAANLATDIAEYQPKLGADDDPFTFLVDAGDRRPMHAELANQVPEGVFKIAVVVYDNFEMLDTFGPMELFGMTDKILRAAGGSRGVEMDLIAEEREVKSSGGPQFIATPFNDAELEAYDMVLLPGGIGTIREVYNATMHDFLINLTAQCSTVMTVCSGSTILASTGLLDNLQATSNKLLFDLLALYGPNVKWIPNARWVVDGKFYTSSGVSAGTDLAHELIKILFSKEIAKEAATLAEYVANVNPDEDPFSGHIKEPTLLRRVGIGAAKAVLTSVFKTGFSLGFKMNGVTPILLKASL